MDNNELYKALADAVDCQPTIELSQLDGEDTWGYDEPIEEALTLEDPYDDDCRLLCEEHDREKNYRVGDILMVPNFYAKSGMVRQDPHRVLVITTKHVGDSVVSYQGFLLSSELSKSNINNENFPNNIHIYNYNSILETGRKVEEKDVFIRVDDVVNFRPYNLSDSGTWKGNVSKEFLKFVLECRRNYLRDKTLNKDVVWNVSNHEVSVDEQE